MFDRLVHEAARNCFWVSACREVVAGSEDVFSSTRRRSLVLERKFVGSSSLGNVMTTTASLRHTFREYPVQPLVPVS